MHRPFGTMGCGQAISACLDGSSRDYHHAMSDAEKPAAPRTEASTPAEQSIPPKPVEIGGPSGPEPTRYGDWERKGRCVDF